MDLLGGIFALLVAILVVVSIFTGFIICNAIKQRTRNAEGQKEITNNETQLDRIESKLDRSSKFTLAIFPYMLGVTAMGVGLGLSIGLFNTASMVIFFIGLALEIIGLVCLFKYGLFSRR